MKKDEINAILEKNHKSYISTLVDIDGSYMNSISDYIKANAYNTTEKDNARNLLECFIEQLFETSEIESNIKLFNKVLEIQNNLVKEDLLEQTHITDETDTSSNNIEFRSLKTELNKLTEKLNDRLTFKYMCGVKHVSDIENVINDVLSEYSIRYNVKKEVCNDLYTCIIVEFV